MAVKWRDIPESNLAQENERNPDQLTRQLEREREGEWERVTHRFGENCHEKGSRSKTQSVII